MTINRLRLLLLLLIVCGAKNQASAQATNTPPPPERISLHTPLGPDGKPQDPDAWITVYRPSPGPNDPSKLKNQGAAVVICPGGGYGGLVVGPEGQGIAHWLNKHGITGIVLEYRLPAGRTFVPLEDAQRALRTARARASDWGLDPQKIGIMGFSAGGHLASTAGTHFDAGKPEARDHVERLSSRPDFQILIYPVISMGPTTHGGSKQNLLGPNPDPKLVELFSNEKQVTAETPPAFLAHALDDQAVVPENSKAFFEALQTHNVKAKYVELPSGGHGLNGYKGEMWDTWQTQALQWLADLKFIPEADAR